MDTADTPRPRHELARLTELPPALRAPLPAASSSPKSSGGGLPISPRLVLRGLARHWWQALILWVVGSVALGALVYLKYKPTYKSTSQILVRIDSTNPYRSGWSSKGLDDPVMQSQIQMITSPNVLSAVAIDPAVKNLQCIQEVSISNRDPEAFLRDLIKVSQGKGNSNLIEVSAETRNQSDAATIVNAVVKTFQDTERELATAWNTTAIGELGQYLETLETKITANKDKLVQKIKDAEHPDIAFQASQGSVAVATGDEPESVRGSGPLIVGTGEYSNLYQEMVKLEYEEIEARAELASIRRQAAGTDPQKWVDRRIKQAFLSNDDVRSLREALRDADLRLEDAQRQVRSPGDPALRRLKADRDRLAERYRQLWADLEPALRAQLASEENNPAQLVRSAEERLQYLQYRRELIEKKFEAVKLDERSRGETALEIGFLRTELAQDQSMALKVRNRLESLQFDNQAITPTFQIVSEAQPGKIAQVNKRDKYLAASPLAMLGLVLGLVTLVEMRSGRVSGADDLSGRLSAEIFSVPPLPTVRADSRGRLEGPERDPKFEQFVQQLDHVRVALCGEESHDGRGRCVLITSAVGGEGKTTLAAQLAVRCAEAGSSTVLIDADLRRATLGRLFEVPDCPGLSDVLRGDASLEDALVPIHQVGGCQLLPAGSPEANPNRILRGKNFAPMLERLRRTFDVVIIDTSPVLPVPDALILGRMADGAVLATRHDQSRFPAVERANSLLAGAGIPVLGVVVNGAKPSGSRGSGGNYYAAYSYRSDRMPDSAEPPTAG